MRARRRARTAGAALLLFAVGCASNDVGGGGAAELESDASPGAGANAEPPSLDDTIRLFAAHYEDRLGPVEVSRRPLDGGEEITLSSPRLKGRGNEPQLLVHAGESTEDVIVLCHGLSDSPYYMRAIGDRFYAAGANVVLPLLPAHGLIDPDAAMEDPDLDRKWISAFDHAVGVAEGLGRRVSLGGFSTGGTLSVHKALSDPERIDGGLFLFGAALHVGTVNENLAWSIFVIPRIAKWQDGHYEGRGPNPYKYPKFPQFGGLELIDVIHATNRLIESGGGPRQPILAVHSIHDGAAMPKGIADLLRADGVRGVGLVVAAQPPLEHARLTLAEDIPLDPAYIEPGERPPIPRAFPGFERMMELVLDFYARLPQHVAPRPAAETGAND